MELINFDRIHWQLKVNYGATTELVDNLIDTGFGDFPEEVIQIGKSIVAEYVSGVLSVPQNPIRGKLLSFIKSQGGKEECSLYRSNLKTDRYNAAFYNGTLCRLSGTEHPEDYLYYTSIVVPAVLTVAEKEIKEGKRVIEAVVLGVETMLRLKDAAKTVPKQRGLDPTSTFGPFGSAVATAKILGYDAEFFEDTLSLCPSQSAGAFRSSYYKDGDSGYLTSGFASSYGIRCAYLAEKGLSGPRGILEGNMGYFECISGLHDDNITPRYDISCINNDFGNTWQICRLKNKSVKDLFKEFPNVDVIRKIVFLIENLEQLDNTGILINYLRNTGE